MVVFTLYGGNCLVIFQTHIRCLGSIKGMRISHTKPCFCGDCRDRRQDLRQQARDIFKEALSTQLLCASDSDGQVRFLRSCSRLEAMAGLLADIDPALIGLQYPTRTGLMHTVSLADMDDACPLGQDGWLLPDGTEIWFRVAQ